MFFFCKRERCVERGAAWLSRGTEPRAMQVCKGSPSQVLTQRSGGGLFNWVILYWKTVIQQNHQFSWKLTCSDWTLLRKQLWSTSWSTGTKKGKEPLQHVGIQSIQLEGKKGLAQSRAEVWAWVFLVTIESNDNREIQESSFSVHFPRKAVIYLEDMSNWNFF